MKINSNKYDSDFILVKENDYDWLIEQVELAEKYKSSLEDIAYHVATPIGEEEDYKKTVYEFIDIAKRALGY